MIYSKITGQYIPTVVEAQRLNTTDKSFGNITRYTVKDNNIPVGRVDLKDSANGVEVLFIKNNFPEKYGHFGYTADQIEVEHCLKRGLKDFRITSYASLNSHALHYLRGKRFTNPDFNDMVSTIISRTPKDKPFHTEFLGQISMYMPKNIIEKYKEIIVKSPLLSHIRF